MVLELGCNGVGPHCDVTGMVVNRNHPQMAFLQVGLGPRPAEDCGPSLRSVNYY